MDHEENYQFNTTKGFMADFLEELIDKIYTVTGLWDFRRRLPLYATKKNILCSKKRQLFRPLC